MEIPFVHPAKRAAPWRIELDALAKAVGGAMLFGVPLLFTMEMWWIGEFMPIPQVLAFLLLALLVNVALARMSGFRPGQRTLAMDVAEACEAMGVGVVVSLAVLLALGQIGPDTSLLAALGMIAVQVIPLSLGATVGNLVFDPDVGRARDGSDMSDASPLRELFNDVGATIAGAMFVGFAIAPTAEVPMLAAGLNAWDLLAVIGLSLLAGYVIVFASGFDPAHRNQRSGGLFQRPFSETMLAYVVSLGVSAALLYGFGQFSSDDPLHSILAQTVALAVPASIGGAAGRVVV